MAAITQMLFEDFPRIELRYKVLSLLCLIAWTAFIAFSFGAIFEGAPGTEYFSQRFNPILAGAFSLFSAGCFVLFLYQLFRANPLKPMVVIDKEGFRDSRFTRDIVRWDYVEAVNLRRSPGGDIIEVLLRDIVPSTVRAQVESKKWWNYRKDGLVITIYPGMLIGMSAEEIAKSLVTYQKQFGTHMGG